MKIKKGFELQCVCDEYLLIPAGADNIDFDNIISLNPSAAYLWEALSAADSFDVDTMVALLLNEYDVDEETAREDCSMILECWQEMGLCE